MKDEILEQKISDLLFKVEERSKLLIYEFDI